MRRRSQRKVIAVDLEPAGRAMREPEIAEDFPLHAFEYPGCTTMPAVRHPANRHRGIKPFGDEADAGQFLRRPAEVLPQAALLAGRREIIFARPRLPGAHARIQFSNFHAPWLFLAVADIPVITVAAEID